MSDINKDIERKFEYLLSQLELSHKRNELVDNQRFLLLQIFFGFQSIVLAASVLKGGDAITLKQQLGSMSVLLPLLAFGIGFSLFVVYLRQHNYMLIYKTWSRNLEMALLEILYKINQTTNHHKGTLYCDINQPIFILESTVLFTSIAMGLLNLCVVALLLTLLDSALILWIVFIIVGAGAHFAVPLFWIRSRENTQNNMNIL